MWLSWGQLQSVRFSYVCVCFPCSQRSSQCPHAPISSSLISLSISSFWPCVGDLEVSWQGGRHLQFDSYSLWSPESEDLGGRTPLRLSLDLPLRPHVQAVPSTRLGILTPSCEALRVSVPFCPSCAPAFQKFPSSSSWRTTLPSISCFCLKVS